MRAAIIDIDGTLADCRHRLHHVLPGRKRDWDAFFGEMDDDDLIWPVSMTRCSIPRSRTSWLATACRTSPFTT